MTDDAERRRRIEHLKDELRLRRGLDEAGRRLAADPSWQAAQERMQDPEQRRWLEQWQEANDLLNEAARELEREEAESPAADTTDTPASGGSRGVLAASEAADSASISGARPSRSEVDEAIRSVFRAIYDEARGKTKSPNVTEVGELARPKLEELGITVTRARLHDIAMEKEFQDRRLRSGVRWPGVSGSES